MVTAGKPLDHAYTNEDAALVKTGCCNLARHISNTCKYGVPVVVAINKFATDTEAELAAVREAALEAGMTPLLFCDGVDVSNLVILVLACCVWCVMQHLFNMS